MAQSAVSCQLWQPLFAYVRSNARCGATTGGPPRAAVCCVSLFCWLKERPSAQAPKRWLTISTAARITTRPKAPEIIIDPGVAIGSAVQHLFGDTTRKHFQFPFRHSHWTPLWVPQLPRGWLQALLPGCTLMRLAPRAERPTSIDLMHNATATWHATLWACAAADVAEQPPKLAPN